MKKVLVVFFLSVFFLSLLMASQQVRAATYQGDAYNTVPSSASGYLANGRGPLCQKFKPARAIFAPYVDVTVKNGNGMNADLELREDSGNRPGSVLRPFNGRMTTEAPDWERASNIDGLETTLTVGNYYWLCMTSQNEELQWAYRTPSMYNDGYLIIYFNLPGEDSFADQDFGFATFTRDAAVPPANENTNSGDSNSNSNNNSNTNSGVTIPAGQSTGSGDAPAATTSAAIKSPTNLKAEYKDNVGKLTWTKSTTADIDGYKVFRSEEKTKDFKEIGKTIKTTLEFVDNQSLVAGKTYFYFVRAYKVKDESASSSTVELVIPAAATPANEKKTIPFISSYLGDETDYDMIVLYWILGGVVGVLLVLLALHEIERKRKGTIDVVKSFKISK